MPGERPLHERTDGQLFAAAAAAVARGDDLDDALAELLGLAAEHLGASSGAVYIVDPDHDELELAVTFGVDAEAAAAAGSVRPLSESHDPLANVTRSRHPLEIDDAAHVAVLRGAATAIAAAAGRAARRHRGRARRAWHSDSPGRCRPRETLAGAEPLADLAAVAVERALALSLGSERAEWFDRLAHTDPLTGLANRRTLDRCSSWKSRGPAARACRCSIAILEIDRFAEIQKAGGNAAGDEALRRVAQILAESVRLMDTVARYGNDQFILVAPGPDGLIVAERLVRGIAALAPVDGRPLRFGGDRRLPAGRPHARGVAGGREEAAEVALEAGGDRVGYGGPSRSSAARSASVDARP